MSDRTTPIKNIPLYYWSCLQYRYSFIGACLLKKCLPGGMWYMIKSHSRCVTKATHTLSDPGRFSATPLKSKMVEYVFSSAHCVVTGYKIWSPAMTLHIPYKVLVKIWIIIINSDNTPIYTYSIINLHFTIIILNFSECICYAIEFGSVVYVNRF